MLFQRFLSFETENLNFAVYCMIDKHLYEQVHLKVEPENFLYKFLKSRNPLYVNISNFVVLDMATYTQIKHFQFCCVRYKAMTGAEDICWQLFKSSSLTSAPA